MNEGDFRTVMSLAGLPDGKMRSVEVQGRRLVLCRTREGVFALDDICTHAFAHLSEGRLRGTRLICPLHAASFDVRDGRVLTPPASQALACHPVRIVDGSIEVALDPQAPAQPLA